MLNRRNDRLHKRPVRITYKIMSPSFEEQLYFHLAQFKTIGCKSVRIIWKIMLSIHVGLTIGNQVLKEVKLPSSRADTTSLGPQSLI